MIKKIDTGYTFDKSQIYDVANALKIKTTATRGKAVFATCPYCHGEHGKHKNTFTADIATGACTCSKCGPHGDIRGVAADFGFSFPWAKKAVPYDTAEVYEYYSLNKYMEQGISPVAKAFLKGYGVTDDVIAQYRVTSAMIGGKEQIVYPLFDAGSRLRGFAYQDMETGQVTRQEGSMPLLFGMRETRKHMTARQCYITSSPLDTLVLASAGYGTAMGVVGSEYDTRWVPHTYLTLSAFAECVVVPRRVLVEELDRYETPLVEVINEKFSGEIRFADAVSYDEYDTPADVAKYHGLDALKEIIEGSYYLEKDNSIDWGDVVRVDDLDRPRFFSRIKLLDYYTGGIMNGTMWCLTGRKGKGKSTLGIWLALMAMDQGHKVYVYSGEMSSSDTTKWADRQVGGPERVVTNEVPGNPGAFSCALGKEYEEEVKAWMKGKTRQYDKHVTSVKQESTYIIKEVIKHINRYHTDVIIIDNLMTACPLTESGDAYAAQSQFVIALKEISVTYNVAIILIAHPKKIEINGKAYDSDWISGSANIGNLMDTIVAYDGDGTWDRYKNGDRRIYITKNRLSDVGTLEMGFPVWFEPRSKRITDVCPSDCKPVIRTAYVGGKERSQPWYKDDAASRHEDPLFSWTFGPYKDDAKNEAYARAYAERDEEVAEERVAFARQLEAAISTDPLFD